MSANSLFPHARAFASALITFAFLTRALSAAPTLTDDFSTAPSTSGWEIHNDASLFVWNSTNENLEVTWDSSKPNSYFRLPFPFITSEDDFAVSLDLLLESMIPGPNPARPTGFQIAFGFQHRAHADATNFVRGTGAHTPNLAEFTFTPDTGYGPTVWPAMFLTNGLLNYNSPNDFGIFDIPIGIPMRITLSYAATNHTLSIQILTNGTLVGHVVEAPLVNQDIGFVLDAFSIMSYSDEGQFPGDFQGSILARGIIDNIELTLPSVPVLRATGRFVAGRWEHEFLSAPGWNYILEGSSDLNTWSELSAPVPGTGDTMSLSSTNAENAPHRFFRVKATR